MNETKRGVAPADNSVARNLTNLTFNKKRDFPLFKAIYFLLEFSFYWI